MQVYKAIAEPYQLFEENGKVGLKNETGQIVLPASFQALGWSDGSFSVVNGVTGYRLEKQWGLINLKKEFITKAEFLEIRYGAGNYVVARKQLDPVHTKVGCLTLNGEIKISFQYDGIKIHGLRAIVFNLNKTTYQFGLLDLNNRVLIPEQYKNIYPLGSLRFAVENQSDKIALFTDEGKQVTDFTIDSISSYKKDLAIVYQNTKQGLVDRNGISILEPLYHQLKIIDTNKVEALSSNEWLFINDKNEIVRKVEADDLIPTHEGFLFTSNGLYGWMDTALKIKVPAIYDQLQPLTAGKLLATLRGRAGAITSDNTVIIPFVYQNLKWDDHTLRALTSEGWSLLDAQGKSLSYKSFQQLHKTSDAFFPVQYRNYWGVINDKGDEFIHCVFDSLCSYSAKWIVVKFKNQYGIIDHQENWKVAPQPFPIELVNDSIYTIHHPQNHFIKKFSGEVIYFTDNKVSFHDDLFTEYLPDGTEKYINYDGVITERVESADSKPMEKVFVLKEGLRGIKKDGKFGFIDSRGRLRIANRYDSIQDFSEGLAAIKLIGKWGFVTEFDKIAINPNYDYVQSFQNGLAIAYKNGKAGLIDSKARNILSFNYDKIERQADSKFLLINSHLKGLADERGTILIEPRFNELQKNENGLVIVRREEKWGVISSGGLSVIPVAYDRITYDPSSNQYLAQKKAEWREIEID